MKEVYCKNCWKLYPKAAMETKDYCSEECIEDSKIDNEDYAHYKDLRNKGLIDEES